MAAAARASASPTAMARRSAFCRRVTAYTAISPREDRQWAAWLEAMGSPAWGNDPRFATQGGSRCQLGCAACADVGMEPPARQAVDRRYGAEAARVPSFPLRELAEQLESPQLEHRGFYRAMTSVDARCKHRVRRSDCRSSRKRTADSGTGTVAAVGRACARFQLGDRGTDDDALSRGDGCRRDQGRGARPRRSRPRIRSAHGAGAGQARHRARPEAAGGGRCRACAGGALRCAGGELRDWRDGSAGARRGRAARAQSGPDLRVGIGAWDAPGRNRMRLPMARCCNAMRDLPDSIAIPMLRRASGLPGSIRCAA